MSGRWDHREAALIDLLEHLRRVGYRFVTPTPRTHAIVLARDPDAAGHSLTDVLGWSRPYFPGSIDDTAEMLLRRADALEPVGDRLKATIRVSKLGDDLFLHSAFPTRAADAVFFGPDTYRFARFLRDQLSAKGAGSIVDIGTGSGVGAIVAARVLPSARVMMTDVNPAALRLARINAAAAGIEASIHHGDVLAGFEGSFDLAIANPPYLIDAERRAYRDGGGLLGAELSLRMTTAVLDRLAPGGRFLLYTGSAIRAGEDSFAELARQAAGGRFALDYFEIDPDVFGEELEQRAYAEVDRIAAVGAVFTAIDDGDVRRS